MIEEDLNLSNLRSKFDVSTPYVIKNQVFGQVCRMFRFFNEIDYPLSAFFLAKELSNDQKTTRNAAKNCIFSFCLDNSLRMNSKGQNC